MKPFGHDTYYSFFQSLSNFIFKLLVMRGGTLLIFGCRFKGQGQSGTLAYGTLWALYKLQFAQSLSNFICKLFAMREGTLLIFLSWSQRSRSTLAFCLLNVSMIQATDFPRSLSIFISELLMMRGPLFIFHGVKCLIHLSHHISTRQPMLLSSVVFQLLYHILILKLVSISQVYAPAIK